MSLLQLGKSLATWRHPEHTGWVGISILLWAYIRICLHKDILSNLFCHLLRYLKRWSSSKGRLQVWAVYSPICVDYSACFYLFSDPLSQLICQGRLRDANLCCQWQCRCCRCFLGHVTSACTDFPGFNFLNNTSSSTAGKLQGVRVSSWFCRQQLQYCCCCLDLF